MKSRLFTLAIIGTFATTAYAFDIGANYSFQFSKNVTFKTNIGSWTGEHSVRTAKINGDRSAGAAGGATLKMPKASFKFTTYCTEIGQGISAGYRKHQIVRDLLGGTTNPGGSSGPVFFDAVRTSRLERLWGSFFPLVDTETESRAFQLAQWELCFDNDATLLNKYGRLWSTNSGGPYDLAESWLKKVRENTATGTMKLLLLVDPQIQDQITPAPEPGTYVALAAGLAIVARRRKK